MTSLLDKIRVGVLANLHELVDQVANTPEAYKQRIRDLEAALAELRSARDETVGSITGHMRELTELEGTKATTQADIDLLLGDDDPSNDESALKLQLKLGQMDDQREHLLSLVADDETAKAEIDGAIATLEDQHREMSNNLTRLARTEAVTKNKSRAAAAGEAARAAAASADEASVDSIEDRIMRDKDTIDARFQRVFDDLASKSSPEDAAALARAKQALDARRAEIAQQAATEAAGS